MRFFRGGEKRDNGNVSKDRVSRHSSGWVALHNILREQEGLRILDIGPTSSTNINLLTNLGHSVYMADLATESHNARWSSPGAEGDAVFSSEEFLQENLHLGDRLFDVVLLWDTLDYLPADLLELLVERLYGAMVSGGRLLAFFHVKPETGFQRYHLRGDQEVDVQPVSDLEVRATFTNRQVENLFHRFSDHRFFLAKDNLREVLVTR